MGAALTRQKEVMATIKRVAYAYNSEVPREPYFLDVLVVEDGVKVVDVHGCYESLSAFNEAIEGLLPQLKGKEDESRQNEVEDVGRHGA